MPVKTNPQAALAVGRFGLAGSYAASGAAPVNALIVSGSLGVGTATPAGLLSVGSANQFQVDGSGDVTARQIIGSGATPTVSTSSGAGTGASVTIVGTSISGVITLTTGSGAAASATVVNVGWSLSSGTAPQGCSLMPRNAGGPWATERSYRCAGWGRMDGECRRHGAGATNFVVVPVLLMRRCGEETVERC